MHALRVQFLQSTRYCVCHDGYEGDNINATLQYSCMQYVFTCCCMYITTWGYVVFLCWIIDLCLFTERKVYVWKLFHFC